MDYYYIYNKTMKGSLTQEEITLIISLYQTDVPSTHKLAERFKVGHKKISQILKEHNIEINKRGGQIKIGNSIEIEKSKTHQYESTNEYELVAKCKKTGIIIKDPNNLSGKLTKHIITHYNNVQIPQNNYQRKKYELTHNKKWFEEYFDIIQIELKPTRKCSLCEWETTDINNKTGCFEQHIKKEHGITLEDYLNQFIDEVKYHPNFIKEIKNKEFLEDKNNYVICRLCGDKMKSISNTHLINKHNITVNDYKLKFPNDKIVSNTISNELSELVKKTNINMVPTWTSKGETEIKDFIESLGFSVGKSKNRGLLNGKEIDLVIDGTDICIEYNGLYYHTDRMGKTSNYHLNKTLECSTIGYKLIHIFEDEWVINKELVKSKIKHLLNVGDGIRIGGRNVILKEIDSKVKGEFLNSNHIQGNDKSTIKYGAFYNDLLVGVMCFNGKRNMSKSKEGEYELSRFATKNGYIISGLGSKMLKRFIMDYKPSSIISFADRRWTIDGDSNLYINLGFKLVDIVKPTYTYYNSKVNKYKRHHKFGFGKNNLKKKYPYLDFNKSEHELMKELGYDRIWDCGLFKYELTIE